MTKSIMFALVLLSVVSFTKARPQLYNHGPWPENGRNTSVLGEWSQGLQRMPKNLYMPQYPPWNVGKSVGDTLIGQFQRGESRRGFGRGFGGEESNGQLTRAGGWSYDGSFESG